MNVLKSHGSNLCRSSSLEKKPKESSQQLSLIEPVGSQGGVNFVAIGSLEIVVARLVVLLFHIMRFGHQPGWFSGAAFLRVGAANFLSRTINRSVQQAQKADAHG